MKLMRIAVLGVVAAFFAVAPAWASLGVHSVDATNPCKKCHDTATGTATLRGWVGASLPDVTGTGWAGRTISSLCYMCHTSGGGGFSATNQSANAYAATAHGNTKSDLPDLPDVATADPGMGTGNNLPYVTKTNMECTSCHNVHKYEDKPFIQRATVATLCNVCHGGRANTAPNRGTNNTQGASRGGWSTHPTGITMSGAGNGKINIKTLSAAGAGPAVNVPYTSAGAYALGGHIVGGTTTGTMDCGTCHAVHGVRQGSSPVGRLLAIDNTTGASGSALCEACHDGGVGSTLAVGNNATNNTDHPIDNETGQAFYPGTVIVPVPSIWAGNRDGAGASPQPMFTTGVTGTPTCSTCHDTHGGIAGTQLLQWPQATGVNTFSYQTWCWVCHAASTIAPKGHHSNQLNWATSQIVCGDCHGAAGSNGWTAHNGFWAFPVTLSNTDSNFCEGCHTATDPTFLITGGVKTGTTLTNPATYPASHGTLRSDNSAAHGGSSHQVDLAANRTNVNLVNKTTAWAGSGGISQWGVGVNNPICESCHNIIVNNVGTATATVTSGWAANLLLQNYEDDASGVGQAGTTVGDELCRGCHTNGVAGSGLTGGFVHNPAAHTINATTAASGVVYAAADVPYGRATTTLMTGGTCPDATTADATGAPGTLSYPAANTVNCDSCHRPHNADADSLDTPNSRYLILEVTAPSAWGTTICAECHNTDTQCQ